MKLAITIPLPRPPFIIPMKITRLISINVAAQALPKLTSNNYISWKLQFHTLFIGYDLLSCVDGSKPCPPATLTKNGTAGSNPDHII